MKKEINVYIFVVSVILSSLVINVFVKKDIYYFKESIISVNNPISTKEFYDFAYYIAIKRLKQFFVIFLLFKTFNPQFVLRILLGVIGMFFGVALTNQIYLYGISGIAGLILCFIPHFPVYYFLIKSLYNCCQNNIDIKQIKCNIAGAICFFALGVVLEIYFSRFFLCKYYQHIVM